MIIEQKSPINQMTFEQLRSNPTVPVETAPRLKKQAQTIYKELKRGPLWTRNLRAMAAQYGARIKELRDYLREFGMTIDLTQRQADGNNRYELRPFHGSRYQSELMSKQKL